jgi:hypothetical protein
MKSRCSRILIAFLLGLSVSIVPIRPHYGLASRLDSPGSALLPRKQQRVRNVTLRATGFSASRNAACERDVAPFELQQRAALSATPAIAVSHAATLPIARFPSHPLRC